MGQLYNPTNYMDRLILGIATESLYVERRVAMPGSTVDYYYVVTDKEDGSEIKTYFTSEQLVEDLLIAKENAGEFEDLFGELENDL